jgi:hypothetical protein
MTRNRRDWTLAAFLGSGDAPGLDLLQWLANPQAFQLRCGEERWSALPSI